MSLRLRLTLLSGLLTGAVLVSLGLLCTMLPETGLTHVLLVAGGALAVAATMVAVALFTRRALAPIEHLTRATTDIAASGVYDRRVPAGGAPDEIEQLAVAINELIERAHQVVDHQSEFVAYTSHELRTPLTIVLANLDLLGRDLDPLERELALSEALAEARRMRRLVNELLLLAQADAGMPLAKAPVQLDALVTECVAAIRRQAPDHDVQIEIAGPIVVQGDQGRLSQLLSNLLLNAVRHTPPGTHVRVRLAQQGQVVELAVADDGPGIPAEHLPHIWDRYYRVHKAHSRAVGGTGLGLPLVKYIAEAHGGHVAVASGAGQGATFTVTLPATA